MGRRVRFLENKFSRTIIENLWYSESNIWIAEIKEDNNVRASHWPVSKINR